MLQSFEAHKEEKSMYLLLAGVIGRMRMQIRLRKLIEKQASIPEEAYPPAVIVGGTEEEGKTVSHEGRTTINRQRASR